jgi:type IV pilus assembly protein PilA
MKEQLRKMRERRAAGDGGFTLIEMLVVVVIIGILVAISIPLYLNYRKGAENKSAESDVRGAISAVEQFYTENGNVYPATRNGTQGNNLVFTLAGGTTETATVSTGNTLFFRNNVTNYFICGQNFDGLTIFVYNSLTGKSPAKSIQTTLAACAANGN